MDPLSCASYDSTSGTGTLAFLDKDRYQLQFRHINGILTATFTGRCNALSVELQLDGRTAVATDQATSAVGCSGARQAHDGAIATFFSGVLTWSQAGSRIAFISQNGSNSAMFRH